jgi:hypothetical protein
MKIIKLKGHNVVYAENQPEYLPLPAHRTEDGVVTSCWGLSFRERIKVLITGRMYLQLFTFNKPLQPIILTVNKPPEI